jgi:hypothetical protein
MNTLTLKKIFLLIILLYPAYSHAEGLGELRLSLIEGDVQIKTTDTPRWAPAAINFPLKDGDQIWVPKEGRAEVKSRRGTIIRLDANTALDVLTVTPDALQLYLSTGLAYVNAKGERDTTLQLDTPLSSIRVYERAKFSAEISDDTHTNISVYLGEISAEGRKGQTMVKAGKILSIESDSAEISTLGMIDTWERWNGEQDRSLEERKDSVRYLPEELAGYANDFDGNGEWVEMPSYGNVWRPTVQVGVDWSPYRHGRWVWIGDDYVWIAHEPWGWAPYHYGRWSYISTQGWCWVPPARHEVYWGPGYVGWVRTPTYVSWVPLAPREIYYGHGNYGPHSVNMRHVDTSKVVVKDAYKNAHVKNSVTTVHNDTFISGRQVDFKVKDNPFLKEKISVGRPQITPEANTMAAEIREIPLSNQPPEAVKNINIDKLRENHRLDKARDKPVTLPEREPPAAKEQGHRSRQQQQEVDNSQPTGDEAGSQRNTQEIQPPSHQAASPRTPMQDVTPLPVRQEAAPPQVSVPSAAKDQGHRSKQQQELGNRQPTRNEAGSQVNTQEILPPTRQEAPPSAVEQEAAPPQVSAPSATKAQGHRPRQQQEGDNRKPTSDEAGNQVNTQEILPPPRTEAQTRQKAPPPAVEQEAPPSPVSAPPQAKTQEHSPRQQREVEGNQRNTQENQPPPPRQEAPAPRQEAPPAPRQEALPPHSVRQETPAPQMPAPVPATRQEPPPPGSKEGRDAPKPGHKKKETKDGKELPAEEEVLPEKPL